MGEVIERMSLLLKEEIEWLKIKDTWGSKKYKEQKITWDKSGQGRVNNLKESHKWMKK